MKKLSSILVLMLIALMLFVSCNNSTPTKESGNSDEVKEASPAEKELILNLLNAAMGAISNSSSSGAVLMTDSATGEQVATFNNISNEAGGLTLNGEARLSETTVTLKLEEGTKFANVPHTLYCEGSRNAEDNIEVKTLELDGKKLKYSEPISF